MLSKSFDARSQKSAGGLTYGLSAYLLWGLFPLFWPLLEPANSFEILACRIVFCFAVIAILLGVRRRLGGVRELDRGTVGRLSLAGLAIAVNWGIYIWGVNNGHVIETSLGYFINPLVTIGLGVLIFHERLRPIQWAAVGLGVIAVAVLSFDYGRPPWIALALACSFATYGFLKKGVRTSAPEGLFVEGAVTTPAGPGAARGPGAERSGLVRGPRCDTRTHPSAHLGRSGHRPSPALLRRCRNPIAAVDHGIAAVRHPRHAIRHRGADPRETTSFALLGGFALVWIALAILAVDGVRHRGATPVVAAA